MLQGRREVGGRVGTKGFAVVCLQGLPQDHKGVACLHLAHSSPLLKD